MNLNNFQPLSGREFPRFSAIKTFFRLPYVPINEEYDVALVGVPFDGGVSYRPGARFAPTHIRNISSLGRAYHWNRGVNVFSQLRFADAGDVSVVPISLEQTYINIEKHFSALLTNKKKFISIGGDHSITLPILRALKKHYKKPLSFIHFDAHLDTYPAAWGFEYHHGAFARHAIEENLVDPKRMIQIGIRGPLAGSSDLEFIKKHQIKFFTVDDVRSCSIDQFTKTLPAFTDGNPVYISYDIDCLDPAFAPGTGTPVPGGFTTYEVQKIFQALKIQNLVGGDIVEVCPAYDPSEITGLAGVDALFEMMCLFAINHR